nr:MAG TPA: Baseplate wedge protein [Caudoviricetes sp.]
MGFFTAELGLPGQKEGTTLSKFLSNLQEKGIAKPTLYRVEVGMPLVVLAKSALFDLTKGNFLSTFLDLYMNAETAEFPGMNILSAEVNYGNQERKFVYGKQFQEVTITFRIDADMAQKKLFDTWMGLMVNPKTKQMGFKDDYVADLKIYQLNDEREITYSYYLINAFPTSVSTLTLGYDQQNTYHKLSVTFAYDDISTSTYVEGIFNNIINSGIDSVVEGGIESITGAVSGALGTGSGIIWDAVKSGGLPVFKF